MIKHFFLNLVILLIGFSEGVQGQSLLDSIASQFSYVIKGEQYRIDYDTINKIPKTVVYFIDYRKLGSYGREDFYDNKFHDTGDKSCYYDSGYDKGHMMSSASSISENANHESFDWVNITPQEYQFNRGIWKRTENFERWNSDTCTYVICGPIIDKDTTRLCDILVSYKFYKIIYRTQDNQSIGFILDQNDYGDLWNYAVPIDSIEKISYNLFDLKVNKSTIDINQWDWE